MADDPGKDIAEKDLKEMDEGNVSVDRNGEQEFVPQKDLSQSQEQEVRTQSNQGPSNVPNSPQAATPESAYEQLANAQADQYLAATAQLNPLTSGSALTSVDSNMSQGAEAMLGQSSTSPISQWLNQQTQAAQAQYAPVASANASLASAEQSGQQLIAGGIQQMGQAETAEMQSAPYSQLLQSLASDVPYKLLDNYNFTNLTGPNVPQGLKLAENNLDITATGQTGGSTPALPAPSTGILSITPSPDPGGAPQT